MDFNMKIQVKLILCLGIMLSNQAVSAVFWTVKAQNGVHTTTTGTVAINIGNYSPTGANPAGTEWVDCASNWIYFHKTADGDLVEDKYVDRMLSVALAAYKTDSRIRVGINRDASGKCYTTQIFDQG